MANLFQDILIFFFISSNPLLSQNDSNIPKLPRAVIIAEQLAGKLVKLENEALVRYTLDPEKAIDHFLFYYSASWSPSCRKFTPDLIEFYNKAKKQNSNFEIVFISSDDSEKAMLAYIKKAKMPWPSGSWHLFFDKDVLLAQSVRKSRKRGRVSQWNAPAVPRRQSILA